MLLSIDPGLHGHGVAWWADNGVLITACYAAASAAPAGDAWTQAAQVRELGDPVDELVIEVPQIYQTAHQKGRQSDLIALAVCVGATIQRVGAPRVTCVQPARWKGQVPKHITCRRAQQELSAEERDRIILPHQPHLQHNVWDAVGIGLWYLKRTQ